MLKITRTSVGCTPVLKLEGRLLEPWLAELLDALAEEARDSGAPRLDLSQVTYVDLAGTGLLRRLRQDGLEIVACSSFVRELLNAREEEP